MGVNTRRRRRPARRSGEQIVEAILDAAGELLTRGGLSGMTTNAVAQRAGVSVGSVYQYFPNKQAICAGVAHRINEAIAARVREASEGSGLTLRQCVDLLVDSVCSEEVGAIALRRALVGEVPRGWAETGIPEAERIVLELATTLTRHERPELSEAEASERALVAVFTVRGAVRGALLHAPELLEDGRLARRLKPIVLGTLLG